jgi:hypothetical protein
MVNKRREYSLIFHGIASLYGHLAAGFWRIGSVLEVK